MGNYAIVIHGTGSHHNYKIDDERHITGQGEGDADKMARDFVQALKDKGHNVESATITAGGREDVLEPMKYYVRAEPDPAICPADAPLGG